MNAKKISRIQITAGVILLVIALAGYFLFPGFLQVSLGERFREQLQEMPDILRSAGINETLAVPHIIFTGFIIQSVIEIFLYLFAITMLILAVLSLILILQGLANLDRNMKR